MSDLPVTSEKASPKDVFLRLLSIITLYASACGFLTLLFQFINIFLPDALNPYERTGAISTIRWSISSLVVIFPVYFLTSWYLNKSYRENPLKRNLRVRRWLIYFTLFIAALIIIGDLVTLVYNLLSGELTARFLLKILAVLFVSGSVFGYYFWDVRKHKTE